MRHRGTETDFELTTIERLDQLRFAWPRARSPWIKANRRTI